MEQLFFRGKIFPYALLVSTIKIIQNDLYLVGDNHFRLRVLPYYMPRLMHWFNYVKGFVSALNRAILSFVLKNCCAVANRLKDAQKLSKLPAFLSDHAASH